MKKNKLKLQDLNVKSFSTSMGKIVGGATGTCNTSPMDCWAGLTHQCETNECGSDSRCATGGEGLGICEAPTKRCPTQNFC
ncbi:MAG: hypothetical protein AAFQ94_12270 [Bacteroidota bacterium]